MKECSLSLKQFRRKLFNQPKRAEFIVTEKCGGMKSALKIFTDIFLSKIWGKYQKHIDARNKR